MAISFPLTAPTSGIVDISIRPKSVVSVSRSPFTGDIEVFAHQGQWWVAEVVLKIMDRATADEWIAFLTSLNGREGTFLMGDVSATTARGSASSAPGTPKVKGASQTGQDLNCDGAPINATGYLLKGDWVQIGTGSSSRLYKNLVDVNSDGSGNFTMTLWPDVATSNSPADNDDLDFSSPVGVWRMQENVQPWSVRPGTGGIYTIESFTCTSEV